jgi:uncharacterized membrane protein SpoIIM required for sporulation
MVLEHIFSMRNIREEPYKLLPLTMLHLSVGVAVYLLLPSLGSSHLVFTLFPLLPIMLRLLYWEERAEEVSLSRHDTNFFEYHRLLLESFSFIFVGAMLATTIWFVALPYGARASVFDREMNEIELIQRTVSETAATGVTGHATKPDFFSLLFWHNLQVLAIIFAFNIFYGVGSTYLLLWNASILGVFTGICMQEHGYLAGFLGSFLGLLPHGIFEVSAYFVASIAGGILSVAIMRRRIERPELKLVALDAAFLTAISIILLFIGALVESSY